jgi:hypothetical protein
VKQTRCNPDQIRQTCKQEQKLTLRKETLRNLNASQLRQVGGGGYGTPSYVCQL